MHALSKSTLLILRYRSRKSEGRYRPAKMETVSGAIGDYRLDVPLPNPERLI